MKYFFFALATISIHFAVNAQIPIDNLLLHMPFNGNAIDETGNGNNGTVNGPNLTMDRYGNANSAYAFDGVDDRIDILNSNLAPDNSVTVNYWVAPGNNWDNQSDHQVMFQSDITGDVNGHFILGINRSNCYSDPNTNDGKINFELQGDFVNNNSTVCNAFGLTRVGTTTNTWIANTWYMITAIVIEGEIKIYVNGQFEDSHPCTSSLFVNGLGITLGLYDPPQDTSAFNGVLDDIRIYSRVLTDQEIGSLFGESLSLHAVSDLSTIHVYPNPVSDQLTVDGDNLAGGNLKIINGLEQIEMEANLTTDKMSIDLEAITTAGVYFVQIYNASSNLVHTEKLIIK